MDYSFSPHFDSKTGRFFHTHPRAHDKSLSDMIGLAKAFIRRDTDSFELAGFPVIKHSKTALATFQENLIWFGHASLLIAHAGIRILTDPHFSERASPMRFSGPKRVAEPPCMIEELPKIDIVLISHNHYDHLDRDSIIRLAMLQPDIQFLVPLGLASQLRKWGARQITELDWWQPTQIKGITLQPTPVRHWSKRTFFDRNKSLWAGWMVTWPDFSFYFAGDSGYCSDFAETARRLGAPDLAAIPIGAYEPREFMQSAHVTPEEAVQIFSDLGARYAVAIHWGTFKLTLEPLDEPPKRLAAALHQANIPAEQFKVLRHGASWHIPFS